MSKKSIFKTEKVPFEFGGETYTAEVQRVYITAEAIMAYRRLMNGLPGMQELQTQISELTQYQDEIDNALAAAKTAGKSDEEAGQLVMQTVGKDALKFIAEFATRQQAVEAAHAPEIFNAKLDVLVPALRGWDIEDGALTLPESTADKKALLLTYGALGEVVVNALWEWYHPTIASSEAGEETTLKAGSTSSPSSTPATESSEKSPQSLLLTK